MAGWLGGKRQLHVQQRQQRRSNIEPSDMDMPGVVLVLGCDPECWLVELNQPTHKLNFQHAFFAGSFNLMGEFPLINLPLCSDQFREPEVA